MLLLTHTNRLSSASARDRYGASYALRQKARMTLYAQSDEDGRLLVGPEKMNNGSPLPASMFVIRPIQHFAPTADDDGTVPLLTYAGLSDRTARQHLADSFEEEHGEDRQAQDIAAGWLESYLAVEGPNADGADVKTSAAKTKISERTLQRAARTLKVVYGRSGYGKETRVTWSLPVQLGATGATGANSGITAGHTVTPRSRQDTDAGATVAQLTDQHKHPPDSPVAPVAPDTDTVGGFVPPSGPGRCDDCGWHVETQGHKPNCAGRQQTRKRQQAKKQFIDVCMYCGRDDADCTCESRPRSYDSGR